jgi:hypothetical protein
MMAIFGFEGWSWFLVSVGFRQTPQTPGFWFLTPLGLLCLLIFFRYKAYQNIKTSSNRSSPLPSF